MDIERGSSDGCVTQSENNSRYSVRAAKLHKQHFISSVQRNNDTTMRGGDEIRRFEKEEPGHHLPSNPSVVKARRKGGIYRAPTGAAVVSGTVWLLGSRCITAE